MITPDFLKKGDSIAIISPAGRIDKNIVLSAKEIIEGLGFKTVVGENAFRIFNQYAGKENERAEDFNKAIENKEVKAILFSRGGYGSLKILDKVNFELFESKPKWLIGYSDISVFHRYVNNLGIESLHATMPKDFDEKNNSSVRKMLDVISGHDIKYKKIISSLDKSGFTEGVLTGGNLSILYSLRGTELDYCLKDKILFIEEVGEYLYHLDRIMMNFKYSGIFKNIKGLIVGGMTNMQDNKIPYGYTAKEIIHSYIKDYDFPVMFDFPAGHIKENYPLIMGRKVNLEVNKKEAILNFNKKDEK